jgi:hypothetical protein
VSTVFVVVLGEVNQTVLGIARPATVVVKTAGVGERAVLLVEMWSVNLQAFLTVRTVCGQRGVNRPGPGVDTRNGSPGVFEREAEFVAESFDVAVWIRLVGKVADVELDSYTK